MTRFASAHVLCIAVLGFGAFAPAADPEKPADRAKSLIDKLTEVDQLDTRYDNAYGMPDFLPLWPNESGAGLSLPRQVQDDSAPMHSLVMLGAKAVPVLLDHLSDDRKTKIVVSFEGFPGPAAHQDEGVNAIEAAEEGERGVRYTVRVGDLSYVALGQIVNREYTAVRYKQWGFASVTCVPRSKKLRAELMKEWGELTAESHRDSLAKDLNSSRLWNGAAARFGYFYPEAFEAHVVKQLTRPAFDWGTVDDFIDKKLYPAKTEKERGELVDEFVRRHGEITRDGLCRRLFYDLPEMEDDYLYRRDGNQTNARECLVQVFGYTDQVSRKDRPAWEPLAKGAQAYLVSALVYDRSEKIDKVVRDWLAETDDDYIGMKLMDRLVGHGHDADIEAFLKRRWPNLSEDKLREYEAKLGWTRLHAAVDQDVPYLIERALKDKLDVNAKAKDGRTALHLAAAHEQGAAMEQLLVAKVDPNVKDAKGKLAVQLAAFEDLPEIVRRLIVAKSQIPDTLVAATVGDADRLAALLKADPAGLKARTRYGLTSLHVAAREGHEKAVRVLLAAGADVNAVDVWDGDKESWRRSTPLHLAAMAGKAGVAKLLLDKGAVVNAVNNHRYTPLHLAADLGHADVAKVLLDAKADRGARDEKGRTPLDLAKERKHAAVVKLLEAGK